MIFNRFSLASTYTWLLVIIIFSCNRPIQTVENIYQYQLPDYKLMNLVVKPDTLQFVLGNDMYNQIKAFNCFTENGIQYISFYDRRSESIGIYNLLDQSLYKKISLKKLFKDRQIFKTSVFVKSWDSFFVINKFNLYIFDSSGRRQQGVALPSDPQNIMAVFDSNKLPVFTGKRIYTLVRPYVNYKSFNALRDWKIMYSIDLETEANELTYHLPLQYQQQYYGSDFLDYNFCYNNRGKFVFSFPADTLLYETDLADYNHSYFARSQFQLEGIMPVDKIALDSNENAKGNMVRDSYGSVFFDPVKKHYLRVVKHKLSQAGFQDKKRPRQTVLIFNEKLKIIGESDWPADADFDSLFFTTDGKLYVRTNFKNENALTFIRFDYQENKKPSSPLANNK